MYDIGEILKQLKVEMSPNKDEYIKLRKDGYTLYQLTRRAQELGEDISGTAFSRYFGRYPPIKSEKSLVKENISHLDAVLQLCNRNMDVLQLRISKIMESDKLEDPQNARIMLTIIKELRMTARDIFNYVSKIKEIDTPDEDHQINSMIAAIKKALPVEYTSKLLNAYEEELKN